MKKAKESHQVEKARQKLKKQIEKEGEFKTKEALEKVTASIYSSLKRRSGDRINLKNKTVELFDTNRHPATIQSRFVNRLMEQLKSQSAESKQNELEGRVKVQSAFK